MKQLRALAAALCLLLPSCVLYPNIGQRIREPGEICTGLALPAVGGKVYKATFVDHTIRSGKPSYFTFYYTQVTEVEFTRRSELFHCGALLDSYPHPEIRNIRPTGRKRLARVTLDKEDIHPTYVAEAIDALPAHATLSHTLPPPAEEAPLELDNRQDFPHTKAPWSRRIAAAPFDYLIEPVLKGIFYTGQAALFIVALPFAEAGDAISDALQQPPPEAEPTAP